MNTFRSFVRQISDIWNQAGAAQRAALVAAGVLLLAAIVAVGIWSSRPQYVTLASGLSPTDAAELAAKLESEGIKYQMSFSGSSLQVSKKNYSAARTAAGDLLTPNMAPLESIGQSFLHDPSLNPWHKNRQREQLLARTLMQFDQVADATVHLGAPEESPFISHRQDVSASVVIQLRNPAAYNSRLGAAIVALVSRGVEGLKPENVIVTDTNGRMLSEGGNGSDMGGQLDYRKSVENDLAANAELMLSQLLGFGKAIVRVTADIDFTRTERKETTYDPNAKVRTAELIQTKEEKTLQASAEGTTGVASNLATGGTAASGRIPMSNKNETIHSNYEVGKKEDIIHEAAGAIKRLTVAAVVDLSKVNGADPADGGSDPADGVGANQVTAEQIEDIIKQAVGFDPNRDDQIKVVVSALAGAPAEVDPVAASPWEGYEVLVKHASLGVGALVALVLTVLILRKVQPSEPLRLGGLDPRRSRALASMSETMRDDPNRLKEALRLWLEMAEDEGAATPAAEQTERTTARAA